jgi:hypothetical protein
MTEVIPPNIKSLLAGLRKSQLMDILLDPTKLYVRLTFTVGIQGLNTVIQLFQVAHFVLSKEPDDEGSFFVGAIDLIPLKDGGKEVLSSLQYAFREEDGSAASYPSCSLFYFRVQGGICIDVVCKSYQIFQEIK